MDEMEEFRITFLQECEELLELLSEELTKLVDGTADEDAINGAFRAVHSIKGGAGVFGFDRLVTLTHTFENVLDQVRSNVLDVTDDVGSLLIRSMDVTSDLVNNARDNNDAAVSDEDEVLAALKDLIGEASENPSPETPEPAPAETTVAVEAQTETSTEAEAEDKASERIVKIDFRPGAGLYTAGHDPRSIFRALGGLGELSVEVTQDRLQTIDQEDLKKPAFDWHIELTTSAPSDAIHEIFEFVHSLGDIVIDDPGHPEDSAAVNDTPSVEVTPAADTDPAASLETLSPSSGAAPKDTAPDKTGKQVKAKGKTPTTLRVNLDQIDSLVNMVGEIVITQAVLLQQASYLPMEQHTGLALAIETLSRQTNELQETVMAIRAQPVKAVFSRMSRLVRSLAQSLGKDAELVVTGEQTEVDTTVIEELAEPLTHMVRNSMDHGLEGPEQRAESGKPKTGTLHLSAEHRGGRIVITLSDDGQGINRERVLSKARERGLIASEEKPSGEEIDNLVFHPGFSTAEVVTDVSGRGVGMDVVRRKIQSLGGRVTVVSTQGKGCIFTITLPLTLAVMDGMIIRTGTENYIVPVPSVVEAMRIEPEQIGRLPEGGRVIQIRGEIQNVATLNELLKVNHVEGQTTGGLIIIVETESAGRLALEVDELIGQQQVVIKSLETNYGRIDGISGGTILGDGHVALILDVDALADMNAHSSNLTKKPPLLELHA